MTAKKKSGSEILIKTIDQIAKDLWQNFWTRLLYEVGFFENNVVFCVYCSMARSPTKYEPGNVQCLAFNSASYDVQHAVYCEGQLIRSRYTQKAIN